MATHSLLSCSLLLFISLLYVGILQNVTPVAGHLMRIVDLHHIELLHNFAVYLEFAAFKLWDDGLSEVYRYYVVEDTQGLHFFFSLYQMQNVNNYIQKKESIT